MWGEIDLLYHNNEWCPTMTYAYIDCGVWSMKTKRPIVGQKVQGPEWGGCWWYITRTQHSTLNDDKTGSCERWGSLCCVFFFRGAPFSLSNTHTVTLDNENRNNDTAWFAFMFLGNTVWVLQNRSDGCTHIYISTNVSLLSSQLICHTNDPENLNQRLLSQQDHVLCLCIGLFPHTTSPHILTGSSRPRQWRYYAAFNWTNNEPHCWQYEEHKIVRSHTSFRVHPRLWWWSHTSVRCYENERINPVKNPCHVIQGLCRSFLYITSGKIEQGSALGSFLFLFFILLFSFLLSLSFSHIGKCPFVKSYLLIPSSRKSLNYLRRWSLNLLLRVWNYGDTTCIIMAYVYV